MFLFSVFIFYSELSILFKRLGTIFSQRFGIFFSALWQSRLLVCCVGPGLKDPNGSRALDGQGSGESLLVCWARVQGSVGRALCIGDYSPYSHVGVHRRVVSLRPTV